MLHLLAPAKLNLYLRVGEKRPDGYHELTSIFERVDLADELTFTPQPSGITVACDRSDLDCGPSNLVTKAAWLLASRFYIKEGAAIHLTKRIPIAAGLGGGSSDAATTLLGLNQLWNVKLDQPELLTLAAELGSDVPFFIGGQPVAVVRGRGERVEPVSGPVGSRWYVLAVPDARLATKDVYEGLDAFRAAQSKNFMLTDPERSLTKTLLALRNGSLGELAEGFLNDLQPEAIRRCPILTDLHRRLRACGALGTLTSGSGPSVFGLCRDRAHAQACLRAFDSSGLSLQMLRMVSTCAGQPRTVGASI